MPTQKKPWPLYGVPEEVKRKVRLYAAGEGLTIADALTDLIEYAYAAYDKKNNKEKKQ